MKDRTANLQLTKFVECVRGDDANSPRESVLHVIESRLEGQKRLHLKPEQAKAGENAKQTGGRKKLQSKAARDFVKTPAKSPHGKAAFSEPGILQEIGNMDS